MGVGLIRMMPQGLHEPTGHPTAGLIDCKCGVNAVLSSRVMTVIVGK